MWKTRDAQCYKKLEQIGEGTYGQVFVAVDIFTKELVAMKKVCIVLLIILDSIAKTN